MVFVLGNTSMDPTLSMIMANMAKVSSGMLVCDPFVGTGWFSINGGTIGQAVREIALFKSAI